LTTLFIFYSDDIIPVCILHGIIPKWHFRLYYSHPAILLATTLVKGNKKRWAINLVAKKTEKEIRTHTFEITG
jgi:hypothetical protein